MGTARADLVGYTTVLALVTSFNRFTVLFWVFFPAYFKVVFIYSLSTVFTGNLTLGVPNQHYRNAASSYI